MQDLIASYLVQKKECTLPLLGNFRIASFPASFDLAEKLMMPPTDEIIYQETGPYRTDSLTEYIVNVKEIPWQEAVESMNSWCLNAKMKLDEGEPIIFTTFGSLQKDETGSIVFRRMQGPAFFEPIAVERALHKDDEHVVLVGDKETTSAAMNDFYSGDSSEQKTKWKTWAYILIAIALLALLFYFSNHNFSTTGIGNQTSVPGQVPAATYDIPK